MLHRPMSFKFSQCSFALLLAAAAPLEAQFNLGALTGTVFDPNGGVVAGCAVKVASLTGLSARAVSTNSLGLYTVPSLPAGTYEVTAEAPGFQRAKVQLTIGVDQTVTSDFHLKLGKVSEQVEVISQATQLEVEKESHEISNVLATQDLQNLPANGRSFMSIASVGPGAGKSSDSAGQPGPIFTYGLTGHGIVLSGQTLGSTTFLQDGVMNMNLLTQTSNIVPSIESIQEVSIESSGMSARFPSPGLVNVISKRGSNAFHGTLYDYLENNALNARSFFAATRPVLRYNQFGANLGAPIVKNKLFGFFDYAGQRQTSAAVSRDRIPTAAESQGNFQADGAIYDPATFNPATGAISPFPNATIPSDRISPFASRFLGYFPAPQGPVVGGINYLVNVSSPSPYDQYLGRADYNLSTKDTLYAEFQSSNSPVLTPTIVNGLFGVEYKISGVNASLQDIHIVSPTLINIARLGYNRSVLFADQQGMGSQNFVQLYGQQNLNVPAERSVPPSVTISGLTNLTTCCTLGNPTYPNGATQNLFQYADELNWTVGRHQIFFGAEANRYQFDGLWQIYGDGAYTFNGQYTSNHGTGSALKLGPGLADFLLGFPSAATGAEGLPDGAFRETDVSGYFQDNWKILPKLTLNLGIRYEFYQPPADKYGRASLFDLPTNSTIFGSWRSNYKNFGPRVGLAYAISNNTVIRSGFGVYYNSDPYQFLMLMLEKLPILTLQSVTENINTPVPATNVFVANPTGSAETPFAVSPREPTPYTLQWNFGIQHSFGSKLLATLSYVGNGSHQQSLRFSPNQAVEDANPLQPTPLQSRRPYPFVGDVVAQYDMANATYNSLQSTLQYRFSHGVTLQANYTWSKALTLSDDGATVPVNGLNARGSYGLANFDRPQVFTAGYVYELPIGAGKPFLNNLGWASKQALGGWQVSGITTAESGTPFQITAADTSNTGGVHTQVANRLCNGNLPSGQRAILDWFQTSCFAQPSAGRLGNSGRNPLWGPGLTNFDLSAFKRFPFGEKRWVQFRTDFFSAFNHPQFAIGATQAITAPTYGQVTSAAGSRLIQMSLQVSF